MKTHSHCMVLTWVLPAATIVAALGCSAHPPAPAAAPDDTRTITMRRSGDSTLVSITQGPIEAENPACTSYCERLASCWYAIPNADMMLVEKDVVMACRKEQHGCRTPTTEAFCCGEVAACQDFAQCQMESREVAMECSQVRDHHDHRHLVSGDVGPGRGARGGAREIGGAD